MDAIDFKVPVPPSEFLRQHQQERTRLLAADAERDPRLHANPEEYVAHCRRSIMLAERGMYGWWTINGFNLADLRHLGIGWDEQRRRYVLPWEEEGKVVGILDLNPRQNTLRWWDSKTDPLLWRYDHLLHGHAVFLCESVIDACTLDRLGFNATCLGIEPYDYERCAALLAQRVGEEPVFVLWRDPEEDEAHILIHLLAALRAHGIAVNRLTVPQVGLHRWLWLGRGLEDLKISIERARGLMLETSQEDHPRNAPRFPIDKLLREESWFLTPYYRWMRESVPAPAEFLWYGGMIALATVLGRRIAVSWGPRATYPNLFVMCIGESGRSFKSSAIGGVSELLQPLGEKIAHLPETDINNSYLLPSSTTPEQFIARLSRRTPCATGTILLPEFSVQVQGARREYMSGWFELLAQLYDSEGEYTKDTRAETFVVQNPCINLLAGVQPRFFNEKLPAEMLYGGFLPRFVILAPQWEHYNHTWTGNPKPRDIHQREQLREFLRSLRDQWDLPSNDQPHKMLHLEPDALERVGQISTNLFHAEEIEGDEYLGSFLARVPTMLVKLCALLSVDLRPETDTIPLSVVELAEPLIRHQKRLVKWVLKGRLEGDFQQRVSIAQKFVERCVGGTVDRGKLLLKMRCPKRQGEEVIEYLESTGFLREVGKMISER